MKILIFLGTLMITIVVMWLLPEPCKINKGGFFISLDFKLGLLNSLFDYFPIALPVFGCLVYSLADVISHKTLTSFSISIFSAAVILTLIYYKSQHNRVVRRVSEGASWERGNCSFSVVDLASGDVEASKASGLFVRELKIADSTIEHPTTPKVLRAWIEKRRGRQFEWLFFSNDYVAPDRHLLCVEVQGVTERNFLADLVLDDVANAFLSTDRINSTGNRLCYFEIWKKRLDIEVTSVIEVLVLDGQSLAVQLR